MKVVIRIYGDDDELLSEAVAVAAAGETPVELDFGAYTETVTVELVEDE